MKRAVNVAVIKGGLHCEELRLGPVEQLQTTEVKHAPPPYPVRLLLQHCQVFNYTEISDFLSRSYKKALQHSVRHFQVI